MKTKNLASSQSITAAAGFRAAGVTCGIKPSGQPDLAVIVADRPCWAAGVFTQSTTPSPSVLVCKEHLRPGRGICQGIVINSGISNAATGDQGRCDAVRMCEVLGAEVVKHCEGYSDPDDPLEAKHLLCASTGLIGHPLPMEKIERGISKAMSKLARGPEADAAAARAIMTTDLRPKQALVRANIGGGRVTLGGIAKGSGMIAPNMATMLAFITTDADVRPRPLRKALQRAVRETFNRTSVDQHTSPSDTVLVLSYPAGKQPQIMDEQSEGFAAFQDVLTKICGDLSYQIVADGEGATRVMRVQVRGAATEKDADKAGRAVVNSPLVKAAVHGGDPNWGRISTAVGYSEAKVSDAKLSVAIGSGKGKPVRVYEAGTPCKLTKAMEAKLAVAMSGAEVTIVVELGMGEAEAEWLGCDLSKEYVTINADYTT
ncbi:MAG: bifunctional glutamate N-acetyltransferase/amino-acid acetyltransferase ArgJ [Rhodospirillales bacterium]|nr:bifunctional glutamate N-acetyltransferase/amino-acid acetyltransferase ArgJ [Rhodospirillales bacterium]